MSLNPALQNCRICPRNCGIDRYQTIGFCGAPAELKINLAQLHYGEEPPISGTKGSGTIFFSHCNLLCVFCQNHSISLDGCGTYISTEDLAYLALQLQDNGAHNINLVTPSHYSLQIAEAIALAKTKGLSIPVLWNSSAYETTETLRRLDGLVDIFLPDFKYYHKIYARRYSNATDYPEIALSALREMWRQVGHFTTDPDGMATNGMLVRILVLPNGLAGVKQSLYLLADEFGTGLALSLMAQYYPAGKANDYPELRRGIHPEEYQEVVETASILGFECVYTQDLSSDDHWTPKFRFGEIAEPTQVLQGVRT